MLQFCFRADKRRRAYALLSSTRSCPSVTFISRIQDQLLDSLGERHRNTCQGEGIQYLIFARILFIFFIFQRLFSATFRGAVANMLVTSCVDNICRLWCETLLPEDGVVCMSQLDPAAANDSKFRTHRQKARFIQRFRHMR